MLLKESRHFVLLDPLGSDTDERERKTFSVSVPRYKHTYKRNGKELSHVGGVTPSLPWSVF